MTLFETLARCFSEAFNVPINESRSMLEDTLHLDEDRAELDCEISQERAEELIEATKSDPSGLYGFGLGGLIREMKAAKRQ